MILADSGVAPPWVELLIGLGMAGVGGVWVRLLSSGTADRWFSDAANRLQLKPLSRLSRKNLTAMSFILLFVGIAIALTGFVRLVTGAH